MKRINPFFAIAGLILVLGIVGRCDSEQAQAEEDQYCQFVKEGTWPNFKNIDCGE